MELKIAKKDFPGSYNAVMMLFSFSDNINYNARINSSIKKTNTEKRIYYLVFTQSGFLTIQT